MFIPIRKRPYDKALIQIDGKVEFIEYTRLMCIPKLNSAPHIRLKSSR